MKMYIGGIGTEASDGATLKITNPASGKLIDTVPCATRKDVDLAIEKAREGQRVWAAMPLVKRIAIIDRFLELVEQEKEELTRLLSEETGKPIWQARNEIVNIPIAFKAFCEKAKHLTGDIIHSGTEEGQERNVFLITREPLGVILGIIPFNFPCDLFDQKVAAALLAGNSVVVKPSSENPLTVCRLIRLLNEAGVTPGAATSVTGSGSTVGNWLVSHPGINAVSMTGSTKVGIETMKNASGHLARVMLELGGNDPFIVFEDADIDLAVEEMVGGRMYNAGQICAAAKRFLIHNQVKKEFLTKAQEKLKRIKYGDPALEDTFLGCLISEKAAIEVEQQVALTVKQGGEIILGGKRDGAFFEPTLIADVPKTADVAKDMEIFGPVVPIIGFDTEEEALDIANASVYGLSSGIFTRDMKKACRVAGKLNCGGVVINGSSAIRSFEMPFGGRKYSGIGNEGVFCTFDEVTCKKIIVLKNII